MGLLDRLFESNSETKEKTKQDREGHIPVAQFYFVGNEIESDPLNESMLVLRQGPPDSGDISAEMWEWDVVKCNEPVEVGSDMDVRVCVYKEGGVVDTGESYQSQMAWILSPEEIEKLSNDDKIVRSFTFPDELRDKIIPPGTRWGEEDLESLLLPFRIWFPWDHFLDLGRSQRARFVSCMLNASLDRAWTDGTCDAFYDTLTT